MGLMAAVQALKQAEVLKEKVLAAKDVLNDTEAWETQHKLQDTYQQVLLLDLEFALDQKVEQELWGVAFKHFISCLQTVTKDTKNLQRNDAQAMLTWFLDAASGFYLSLLQQICSTFHLDLPFRRRDAVYGMVKTEKVTHAQHSSCMYICQHCLVHLGDIARYRGGQHKQAEAFYRHAMILAPSSGQPYNQLALLAASRGDQLSTVFHYVRSIAVRHPFPAAATNLERTLKRCADQNVQVKGKTRVSASEFVSLTLKLHGLLRCHDDVTQAQALTRTLATSLTALVATQALSACKLVQLLMVHIYMAQDASPQHRSIIIEVVAASLNACLLPAYTLSQQDALLQYFALPAIKLTLQWLLLRPALMTEVGFSEKRHIWPSLCQLLNSLHAAVQEFDAETYSEIPLPEDKDLQGFLPLHKFLTHLRFEETGEVPDFSHLRASRLVKLGKKLSETQEGGGVMSHECGVFSAVGQTEPAEIIRELEELNLNTDHTGGCLQTSSPALSDAGTTSSWGTGKSTPDSGNVQGSCANLGELLLLMDPVNKTRDEVSNKDKVILTRPQPEKPAWTQQEPSKILEAWESTEVSGGRRRQNVAMQAILRSKAEESAAAKQETKQVTFKSPSISPAVNPSPENATSEDWKSPLGLLIQSGNPVALQQQPNNVTSFTNTLIQQSNNPVAIQQARNVASFTNTLIQQSDNTGLYPQTQNNVASYNQPSNSFISQQQPGNTGYFPNQSSGFPQAPISLLTKNQPVNIQPKSQSGNHVNYPSSVNNVVSCTQLPKSTQQNVDFINYSKKSSNYGNFGNNVASSFPQAPGSFKTSPSANFLPAPNFPSRNDAPNIFQFPSDQPLVPSFPPPPIRSELWQDNWSPAVESNTKDSWGNTKDTKSKDVWGNSAFSVQPEAQAPEGKSYSLFSPPPAWCLGQSHSDTSDKSQSASSLMDSNQAGASHGWNLGQSQAENSNKSQSTSNIVDSNQVSSNVGQQVEWGNALQQPAPLQSLWSGPTPLERLLQQQRQQREGGT